MSIQSGLSHINWADNPKATFSTTSAKSSTSLPVENVTIEDINQVWGITNLDSGDHEFDLLANLSNDGLPARDIGVVAVVFGWRIDGIDRYDDVPIFSSTDTIRLRGFSDLDAGGTTEFDSTVVASGVDSKIGYHVFVPSSTVSGVKSIQADFVAASRQTSPDNYVWVARFWAGPLLKFIRGFSTGHKRQWSPNEYGDMARTPSYPFPKVKDQSGELETLEEFEQLVNTRNQFLFVENVSNPHKTTLIGKRDETTGFQSQYFKTYGFTLKPKETW